MISYIHNKKGEVRRQSLPEIKKMKKRKKEKEIRQISRWGASKLLKEAYRSDKLKFERSELAIIAYDLLHEADKLSANELFYGNLRADMIDTADGCEGGPYWTKFKKRSEVVEFIYDLAVWFCPEED